MSLLQEKTLNSFLEAVGKKTLNEYSEITGIERTRLFRLFHGAEMKLGEFETLQSYILKSQGEALDWENVVSLKNFRDKSQEQKISESLAIQMERSQRLTEFLNEMKGPKRRAA